ncbi:hypothetical protein CFE_0787 [Carboxydocella thermautotrophica]|uniref:Uncharacterized protein n=1 Tax=Carboxydocella thermautotrophica TaxID=178899 RepID=A0A2R4MYQ5_CARTR|nr:hypothetical protein CFE_0787 [Carboxydocella thermautotrophica]
MLPKSKNILIPFLNGIKWIWLEIFKYLVMLPVFSAATGKTVYTVMFPFSTEATEFDLKCSFKLRKTKIYWKRPEVLGAN